MKVHKSFLFFILLLALLLGGCSSRGQLTNWPAISQGDEMIYLSRGADVIAWNAKNQTEMWRFPQKPDGKLMFFAPAVLAEDGQLIVGGASKDTRLFSLDAKTGAINWIFDEAERDWLGSVLIYDDVIYAPNADGWLYALDLQGNLLWRYDAGSPLWATPATDGNLLFLTALNHEVHAIDLKTGESRWAITLPSTSTQSVAVDTERGRLYIGGLMDQIMALDAQTGETVWIYATKGWVWQTPVLQDGVLYFGDQAGAFYALNVDDQTPLWDNLQPDGGVTASPLVTDEQVFFVTEEGSVYSVSLDGNILWSKHVEDAAFYTQPVLLEDGAILVAPMNIDPVLMAYGPNGQVLWQIVPEK